MPDSGPSGPRLRPGEGLTVWLTGLPSAGKTTVAAGLQRRLVDVGLPVEVLDGDVVRSVLSKGLGYSKQDRVENILRTGFVANLLSRHGVVVICALISPYRAAREQVRLWHGDRFFEVYLSAPVDVCARRDVKGLYARQRRGEIANLTGVDDPYEAPRCPDLVLPTHLQAVDESVAALCDVLLGAGRAERRCS